MSYFTQGSFTDWFGGVLLRLSQVSCDLVVFERVKAVRLGSDHNRPIGQHFLELFTVIGLLTVAIPLLAGL